MTYLSIKDRSVTDGLRFPQAPPCVFCKYSTFPRKSATTAPQITPHTAANAIPNAINAPVMLSCFPPVRQQCHGLTPCGGRFSGGFV